MTITFPRTMPAFGLGKQRFELDRVDYMSPQVRGAVPGVSAGPPKWTARWPFTGMEDGGVDIWRAWIDSLRGSQRTFFGADQARSLPKAYMASGLPSGFNGNATSWTTNTDRDALKLGIPEGFQISTGDYVGFKWGSNGWTKVRALEGAIGPNAFFSVEPAVPMVVPSNAVAYLNNPVCLMRLTPETDIGDMDLDGQVSGQIVAIQDLRG